MPLSAVLLLEKTTDLPGVSDKLNHIVLYGIHVTIRSRPGQPLLSIKACTSLVFDNTCTSINHTCIKTTLKI